MADRPVADIFELQRVGVGGALVAHRADQPRPALAGQREDAEEIGLVEIDMQFAIDGGPGRLDVGDVEDLPIGAARKAGADGLAHDRAGAVAAGDVGRRAATSWPSGPRSRAATRSSCPLKLISSVRRSTETPSASSRSISSRSCSSCGKMCRNG